ncbi:rap guanine nucleotide exchange factor 1 [Protopterus annectens]|uniref:rap guanine nucleotide exchange factor 1 n=1 Tax=Protopterus annectens TaxID=7888 RepID=UPI001CFAF276|nr:rap guanine nucleotide exchange factor 1 [Protopterus annectens]
MSGKIEKPDSQRSHLSSLTMKIIDKFHSPKIKRTPSRKTKPAEITLTTLEKPANKHLNRLEEQEKEVVSALRYFKTIVDKMAIDRKVLEILPGSASKVLEAIIPLVQVDVRIQQSSAVSSCCNRVYQSLANLIRWSDQVMLEGVNLDDKDAVVAVTSIIKAVLDGVKELVRLLIEKQEQPSPTTPVKPSLPACKSDSISDLPLTDREKEILSKTTPVMQSSDVIPDEEAAPPKPPLPGIRVVENSPPPALPPKKRSSAPSPTRVAVVAPMSRAVSGSSLPVVIDRQDCDGDCYTQRRRSGGSHSYGGESPRLSPCGSMNKLSKSDEQLSSIDRDSGQCSRNTSCETLDNYDPDYDFLHQDLSNVDHVPGFASVMLSPLPEYMGESVSPFQGQSFQIPTAPLQPENCKSNYVVPNTELPPALPEKKRRSSQATFSDVSSCTRTSYERHPSQYDNISEEDIQNALPVGSYTPFAAVSPLQHGTTHSSLPEFSPSDGDLSETPPPLPEKKKKHIQTYMQFVEDYSEPQPSMFYQTPQNELIYQQKNKHLMEVYGIHDSFSSTDSGQDLAPPPALPPKQRQLASFASPSFSSSFSSVACYTQQCKVPVPAEDICASQIISTSVSNSSLSQYTSFTAHSYKSVFRSYSQDFAQHNQVSIPPFISSASSHFPPVCQSRSSDLAVPAISDQSSTVDVPSCSSQDSSNGSAPFCLPSETSLTDSLQTCSSENASEEAGEGEYVNLYSSSQTNGELSHSEGESTAVKDTTLQKNISSGKEGRDPRWQRSADSLDSGQCDEEVDELCLMDHDEIVSRLTLKQEGDDGPDVRGGSADILLVHATETYRKDLILYCEAFLMTYRTFMTPEELIKKLQYRYEKFCNNPDKFKKRVSNNTFFVLVRVVDELCMVELTDDILKLLMDLVFRLVCNGELSLARVLRNKNLEKVEQKRLLRCVYSSRTLASKGVAARPGTLHDFHSHEIADQLTLLDAELFYKIEIPEVLLWAKEQNEEKSPNLTQFTEHFNNMSYWVRSIIILQEKAQDRERLLLKFIKIMKHLRKLNNFNSYLAILSALDSAPIRRLEWQKQTTEGLAEYCMLIDSSSSFRAYRAALAEREPPCIPYLGLILQDLTFVHLGNPDYIDGKVNFSKRWQQFNILDSMRRFQLGHYDIKKNEDIISFFNDFSDHLAEEALWELSLKIKPRTITRRRTEREEKT